MRTMFKQKTFGKMDQKRSLPVSKAQPTTKPKAKSPAWIIAKDAIASGLRERAEKEQVPHNVIKQRQVEDHSSHHGKLSRLLHH